MGLVREYQAAHGGAYPYVAQGYEEGLTNTQRLLYANESSGSEMHKGRLAFDGGMGSPAGPVYGFNMSALHDYMAVVETCPVTFQGDGEQGAIMACAGRGCEDSLVATQAELRGTNGEMYNAPFDGWEQSVWGDPLQMTLDAFYGTLKDGSRTIGSWVERLCTWHHVKLVPHLHLIFDAYYAAFYGAPKMADLPPADAHEEAPCAYATGELFTWRQV